MPQSTTSETHVTCFHMLVHFSLVWLRNAEGFDYGAAYTKVPFIGFVICAIAEFLTCSWKEPLFRSAWQSRSFRFAFIKPRPCFAWRGLGGCRGSKIGSQ